MTVGIRRLGSSNYVRADVGLWGQVLKVESDVCLYVDAGGLPDSFLIRLRRTGIPVGGLMWR